MQKPLNDPSCELVLIRHASTAWNEQGLYQGRRDIPLSAQGTEELSKISVPEAFQNWKLYSSPLQRAIQTAEGLFGRPPQIVPAAIEHDFGDWEGQSLQSGPDTGWTGLDSPIPGGESIRQVQERMQIWLKEFYALGERGVLITHKGVILAMVALATGWNVEGKKPFKLDSKKIQRLQVLPDGKLKVLELNVEFSSK